LIEELHGVKLLTLTSSCSEFMQLFSNIIAIYFNFLLTLQCSLQKSG